MAWSIVNIPLPTEKAVRGNDAGYRAVVEAWMNQGYEPFSTASFGAGIVISLRKWQDEGAAIFGPSEGTGQYL